jgi:hypothetical protein
MSDKKHTALAQDYFERHTTSNECFITSDERIFHAKSTADNFANDLEDKTVESFTRAEAVKEVKKIDPVSLEDLKNFDAATASYEDAKAIVKAFSIEVASQKKEDLFSAILSEQAKIQA